MSDLERIVYLKPGQAYRLSPSESVTLMPDTSPVGDLDKKLEELINEEIGHCCSIPNMSENIDKLKQAFIDDGWVKMKVPNHAEGDVVVPIIDGYLSGLEWYDKFEKELSGGGKKDDVLWSSLYYTGKRKFDNEQYREVEAVILRAAKKASGIEK